MVTQVLFAWALFAAALACVLFAVLALGGLARLRRGERALDHALDQRAAVAAASTFRKEAKQEARQQAQTHGQRLVTLFDSLNRASLKLLDTPLGTKVVAPEDRRLLERCGFVDVRARARFFAARIGCACLLPLLVLVWTSAAPHGMKFVIGLFVELSLGFMAPKWAVGRAAAARQRAVNSELPMFVDLLRLLQGVGLSLDQSLQVIVNDFATVLPVLSQELAIAHRQFSSGRSREQSLQRLSTSFESDDLSAIVRLMIQVDKHGGAVQEPLKAFGDRLRESRRALLRERIGALTVKMTGVMVMTLLPALLIITAGPGFIAVLRSLSSLAK